MPDFELSKNVLHALKNDELIKLTQDERLEYYVHECARMGLDPASRPLAWAKFRGDKLVLYADRRCGDMLAAKHGVTMKIMEGPCGKTFGETEVMYCLVRALMPDGRYVEDVGSLPMTDVANAVMKVVSKASRRATLRLCGWGGLDESELETIPGVQRFDLPTVPANDTVPPPPMAPPKPVIPAPNPDPALEPGDALMLLIKRASAEKKAGTALMELVCDVEQLSDATVTDFYAAAWVSLIKKVPVKALSFVYDIVSKFPSSLRATPAWDEAHALFERHGLGTRDPGSDDAPVSEAAE